MSLWGLTREERDKRGVKVGNRKKGKQTGIQVRKVYIDILEDEVCLRCGPAPELKYPLQSSAVTSLFKSVSLQVGSQHTRRIREVTCTVNQPSTSMLSALQLTPPV